MQTESRRANNRTEIRTDGLPIIGLYEKIFLAALSFVSLPFKVLIVVEILFFTFMRYSCK